MIVAEINRLKCGKVVDWKCLFCVFKFKPLLIQSVSPFILLLVFTFLIVTLFFFRSIVPCE